MAGFGGKGKRDAPKGRSTAPSSMIGVVGLIARGDRAVPVTVQARIPVAAGDGFDIVPVEGEGRVGVRIGIPLRSAAFRLTRGCC